MKEIVFRGSYNPTVYTYNYFTEIQAKILKIESSNVVFDFRECKWFHASLTALLGGLIRFCNYNDKSVNLITEPNSAVDKYFKNSGLLESHFNINIHCNQNAIPLKEIEKDDDSIVDYITNILELAPVTLTNSCREAIFTSFYEIFSNANEHSNSIYGIHSCGHWFPYKRSLVFSLYDTGVGIPSMVKRFLNPYMSSEAAILWALAKGNSTKQLNDGIPRGLGLTSLIQFIDLNGGTLSIVSNDVMYIRKGKKDFFVSKENGMGTLIYIEINSDYDHIYTYG